MSITFQPTFVLKKVDPLKIMKAYTEGAYSTLTLPKTKISVEASTVPSITGATNSFRDKYNCIITIHTSNNEAIKALPTYKPRCFWCMQDLVSDKSAHVPIPTNVQVWTDYSKNETTYYFETDAGGKGGGCCCSFQCALSYVRHFTEGKGSSYNYSNEQKEIYLRTLYNICYPNNKEPLQPAPDFRLLHYNGGTMTPDEFKATKSVFIPLPNIIMASGAHQFMLNSSKP